jgi:hypothetical protein
MEDMLVIIKNNNTMHKQHDGYKYITMNQPWSLSSTQEIDDMDDLEVFEFPYRDSMLSFQENEGMQT